MERLWRGVSRSDSRAEKRRIAAGDRRDEILARRMRSIAARKEMIDT